LSLKRETQVVQCIGIDRIQLKCRAVAFDRALAISSALAGEAQVFDRFRPARTKG
jgi:hypothetical protein